MSVNSRKSTSDVEDDKNLLHAIVDPTDIILNLSTSLTTDSGEKPRQNALLQASIVRPSETPSSMPVQSPDHVMETIRAQERGDGDPGFLPIASTLAPQPRQDKSSAFWARNKGVALVVLSQLFSALMNVATRLLATDKDGMETFQVGIMPRTAMKTFK